MLRKHTLHGKPRAADILFLTGDNRFIHTMHITLHRTLRREAPRLHDFGVRLPPHSTAFGRTGGYLASEFRSGLNTEAHKHRGGMGCKNS
jgi:hypothetical protein